MSALAAMFHLPQTVKPFALVAIGYAAANSQAPPDRFDSTRVSLNDWNKSYPA